MSSPVRITSVKGRAYMREIGDALLNTDPGLSNAVLMKDKAGANAYLPVYRSGEQSSGGKQQFETSFDDKGILTVYLEAAPAPAIAQKVGSGKPNLAGTSFALALHQSGKRFALKVDRQGDLFRLTAPLSGDDLRAARAALFDVSPNVAIEVTQTAGIATPLSEAFVRDNWANASIRQALIGTFHFPADDPETFFAIATQADPQYTSQFMVLECTYRDLVPVPPLPGYVQWQIDWAGRAYNYYQDNQDRSRFFYRPDSFELTKGLDDQAAVSLLQFSLPEGQSTVDKTRATFRFYGKPVVQFDRIEAARKTLAAKSGMAAQMVSLQDARGLKTAFTQILPNSAATGSDPVVQPKATIDLSAGLRNELDLNFVQFRELWRAIFSPAQQDPIFRGWVDVELSDGRFRERIDFTGRLPKQQETVFFDDILTTTDITYASPLTVKARKSLFDIDSEMEVELTFGPQAVATLTNTVLEVKLTVRRSIREIVLTTQSPDQIPYRMRVIRDELTCCDGLTREVTLVITADMVNKCKGKCS